MIGPNENTVLNCARLKFENEMNYSKDKTRGQGATEYLVILGAVLLVALAVMSVSGQATPSSASIKEQQSSAYWSGTYPISISVLKLTSDTLSLKLVNRESQKIRITSIQVGNSSGLFSTIYSGTIILNAGEEFTLNDVDVYSFDGNPCRGLAAGKAFEVAQLVFSYDTASSLTNLTQAGTKPFVGKCGWSCGGTINYSGNIYNKILIGNQCWLKENLNVGTRTNGVNVQGTSCSAVQKYCYSDSDANCATEGGLYQWDQAMCGVTAPGAQGICPVGWHVPTHDEWTTLERAVCTSGTCATDFPYDTSTLDYRGTDEGSKLSMFTQNGNNASGYTALLSGGRYPDSLFYYRTTRTYVWSSTQVDTFAWRRTLYSTATTVGRATSAKTCGFSVRCLKN